MTATPPPNPAEIALLNQAFEHHRARRIAEASVLYREVLAGNPTQHNALMLLGLLMSEGSDLAEAETLFQRYLAVMPDDPTAHHHLGKLLLHREAFIDAVPCFLQALALRSDHAPTYNDLGVTLHRLRDHAGAIAALNQAVGLEPELADAWYNLGAVHFDAKDFPAAEVAFRQTLVVNPDYEDARHQLAATLEYAHRPDEAEAVRIDLARREPVQSAACTEPLADATILFIAGAGLCNVRPDFLFSTQRYNTVTRYLLGPADPDFDATAIAQSHPDIDLVFSIIADADRAMPYLPQAEALCREYRCPILNAPGERIVRTRRDLIPALLQRIPGLIVPRTRRLTRAELTAWRDADETLEQKMLLRPSGSHGGNDLALVTHSREFDRYLTEMPYEHYYLIDFQDYQSSDGYFRKYRLIFVDRKVYPYHLAICPEWMIHYFRADMADQAWMRAEEARFLADYTEVFGGPLKDAVEEVARRLDLDYAGMDCGITRDGQIVLFEANPTMLVHLNDREDIFPYKHQYVPRIFNAINSLVRERLIQHDRRSR